VVVVRRLAGHRLRELLCEPIAGLLLSDEVTRLVKLYHTLVADCFHRHQHTTSRLYDTSTIVGVQSSKGPFLYCLVKALTEQDSFSADAALFCALYVSTMEGCGVAYPEPINVLRTSTTNRASTLPSNYGNISSQLFQSYSWPHIAELRCWHRLAASTIYSKSVSCSPCISDPPATEQLLSSAVPNASLTCP